MVLIVHNVRSVYNVASMFRTADAAGVEKIYLTGYTPIPMDRFGNIRGDFAKVALGAQHTVTWERCVSVTRLIARLKRNDYCIVVLEQDKRSVPYYKAASVTADKRTKKIVVLVGNEVRGLSEAVLKKADIIAQIPMGGAKESLNVAVAAGILLFRLRFPFSKRSLVKKSVEC